VEAIMESTEFDGTLVLEKLAEIDKLEDFFAAIDSDDVARAKVLLRRANVDATTIAIVVKKMEEGDADH
jgi:hypothetical protein